jgi:hypothetical protein
LFVAVSAAVFVLLPARAAASPPCPPQPAKACGGNAHIHITPSGWTYITPQPDGDVGDASFCLDVGPAPPGVAAPAWNAPKLIVTSDDGTPVGDYCPIPGNTYALPDDGHHHGFVNVDISDPGNQTALAVLATRLLAMARADSTYKAAVAAGAPGIAAALGANPGKTSEDLEQRAAQRAVLGVTDVTVYRGVLPTTYVPAGTRRIVLGAWDGATATNLDLLDGETVDVFAFGVDSSQPQDVEVIQGVAVTPGPLAGQVIKAIGLLAPGAGIGALGGINAYDNAMNTYYQNNCGAGSDCARQLAAPNAVYTSVHRSSTVIGGYTYSAQVCRDATTKQTPGSAAQQPPAGVSKACTGATPDQITASAAFKTHTRHRVWSVGVEVGWDTLESGDFSLSGYGYQPVGQSGPDQLYQLQGQSKAVDRVVFSALLLLYPLKWGCGQFIVPWCANHVAVGFGPSLWRGAAAEPFHQWNFRALYEITSGVLVSFGPSLLSYNAPVEQVGTLVSVPRPAQTPSVQSTNNWTTVWTVGLTVDLSLLGDAVSAVAAAATPNSGSSANASGKTGGKP